MAGPKVDFRMVVLSRQLVSEGGARAGVIFLKDTGVPWVLEARGEAKQGTLGLLTESAELVTRREAGRVRKLSAMKLISARELGQVWCS